MTKICLIGLGLHSKRIYYKFMEERSNKRQLEFNTLVDLEVKKEDISNFLENRLQPKNLIFVPTKGQYNPDKINPEVEKKLLELITKGEITKAIVGTEPKAHKIYIEFFIKNKIPVLTDKPLTAPVGLTTNSEAAEQVYKDAEYLANLSKKHCTPIYVQVQRREHPAYKFIFDYAKEIIQEYKMPITYFDIFHCDGSWNMPPEYYSRENHPYKYGYGKIMHSGYHFADLVARIAETNSIVNSKISIDNRTSLLLADEHYIQINGDFIYQKLFNQKTTKPQLKLTGELDSYSTFEFFDELGNILTHGKLDMLQSGYSRRKQFELPKDTYKGNGRVRHERFVINIGSLCTIQLHSYQSDEVNQAHKQGFGGEEHLDVYVYRNSHLIGGKTFEKKEFGKIISQKNEGQNEYIGQNEHARNIIFDQFVGLGASTTLIEKQLLTNQLISSMYLSYIQKQTKTIIL